MPPTPAGITNPHTLVDIQDDAKMLFRTWVTSTDAFAARSAKADSLQTGTGTLQQASTGFGAQASATYATIPTVGQLLMLGFVGEGADNATIDARIWLNMAIRSPHPGYENLVQHTPVFALEVRATLSAKVGIASGIITADQRYADTIAYVTSEAADDAILSPAKARFWQTATAGNTVALVAIDVIGRWQVGVDLRCETATKANCFWFMV